MADMKFAVLGSGSRGNASILSYDETNILIDSGFSMRETFNRMNNINILPEQLDAILVTHGHADHVRSAVMIANRLNIPLWCSESLFPRLASNKYGYSNLKIFKGDAEIKQLRVTPIAVPHDAPDTMAFFIRANGKAMTIATDMGELPAVLKPFLKKSRLWLLESNHDPDMLKYGPYPHDLKERVRSKFGHLSNQQAYHGFQACAHPQLQTVILGHISQKNNTPEHVSQTFSRYMHSDNCDIHFKLALQDEHLPFIPIE